MNKSNLNKKLVNNLILGSFLFGSFVSISTTVYGTSMPPKGKQGVHQYNKETTEQLRALRSKLVPVEEWIKWVDRENGADPNEQVRCLVPLEEAILRGNLNAVDVLIKRGADLNRIVGPRIIEDRYGNKREKYGRTLLHLAVYSPEKMRVLMNAHIIQTDLSSLQRETIIGAQQRGINPVQCFTQRHDTMPTLHASAAMVELLLKNMPREIIHASENGSTDKTPLNLALANRNQLANGIKKGEYDAREYTSILKEYEAIFDLLQKHAPPQDTGSIPPWYDPPSCTLLRHGKK
jgi:hypothetical protein